jgi:hypothetical protein
VTELVRLEGSNERIVGRTQHLGGQPVEVPAVCSIEIPAATRLGLQSQEQADHCVMGLDGGEVVGLRGRE